MKLPILILLICVTSCCFSQHNTETTKSRKFNELLVSPGIIIQHDTFLEFNLFLGSVYVENNSKIPIVGANGFRLGIESNIRSGNNYTIAPKIGYELSATVYVLRLSAVNYFQNSQSEFRLLPELGISLGGWANLTYGYGIPLKKADLNNVSHHRLALSFNLDQRLKNFVFKN
ncbi:MAG: hypothetical protein GYB32_11480 [Algicola sp.]|nr:hypothetical protein [Algicola sp.]